MTNKQILLDKYLDHLDLPKEIPSNSYLIKLIKAQLIKFPFENISKLILWSEGNYNKLIDLETHLNNSIKLNCGGTCYANNFYFCRLLKFLGFDVSIHGADMGTGIDVHLVLKVNLNDKIFLVDVGYGAPFSDPFYLSGFKPQRVKNGELEYKLVLTNDNRFQVLVFKRNNLVHDYIVNNRAREIEYFADEIKNSFYNDSEFMDKLRIFRFFDDHSIELNNNKYIVNSENSSDHYFVKNIDELKEVVTTKFDLPNLPIEKAYEVLFYEKKIDIFS
jgi:arylamine N-acetyltransferase